MKNTEPAEPSCRACGTPWVKHLGMEGTCAKLLLAKGDLAVAQKDLQEAREALSELAFYLSVGSGDDSTTAEAYKKRITNGINAFTDPLVRQLEGARASRDAAESKLAKWVAAADGLALGAEHAFGVKAPECVAEAVACYEKLKAEEASA